MGGGNEERGYSKIKSLIKGYGRGKKVEIHCPRERDNVMLNRRRRGTFRER
jgi:hypothetical protein